MRRLVSIVAVCGLAACGQQQAPAPASAASTAAASSAAMPAHAFSPAIDAGDFAAHVQVLSSDAFGGREPGTQGESAPPTT
jgi:hypothetical protein